MSDEHRAGIVAVLGRPNVGKSTLINRLLRFKLSIVSPRPQTTRNRVMGIYSVPDMQVAFVDTPGVWRGLEGRPLHDRMLHAATATISGVDAALLLIDPQREAEPESNRWMLDQLADNGVPTILAINKIDRRDRRLLLPVLAAYGETERFTALVPISALKGDGLDPLLAEVRKLLPVSPPLFPEDMVTVSSERFLCSELVREKVFRRTGQEIPYSTAVEIEKFDAPEEGLVRIFARVLVEKDSQRKIVVGKGGEKIRTIGTEARQDIERLLGRKVYLDLHVTVSKDWSRSDREVDRLGGFD